MDNNLHHPPKVVDRSRVTLFGNGMVSVKFEDKAPMSIIHEDEIYYLEFYEGERCFYRREPCDDL